MGFLYASQMTACREHPEFAWQYRIDYLLAGIADGSLLESVVLEN